MTVYCNSCGASLDKNVEGWYYCPEEDIERYFSGDNNKRNSNKKRGCVSKSS